MKKLNSLALAVSLLAGAQSANALTPWVDGAPDITIITSGGAAQDKAYGQVVNDTLAASGTLDTFGDLDTTINVVGARWTAFYFTGNASLGLGLAGKKILLKKRTQGAAGYGIVPVISAIPLEQLVVEGTALANWTANGVNGWKRDINAGNAATTLVKQISDAGFSGVDADILLKPGTQNYPVPVPELSTGLVEPGWPTTLKALPATFTVANTGGLVYGVAVTLDLYKVLQAAEKRAGRLPSTVAIGTYGEDSLPNLNRNVIASLLAGKVGAWDQIKIVDKTDANTVKSLLHTDILTDAGVTGPYKEATSGKNLTPVAFGKRNNGAAVGAVASSKFLNYPAELNAFAPAIATPDNAVVEDASLPIIKAPTTAGDTGSLLKDWQNGTNTTGFNNVLDGAAPAKRWGIAINTADRNSAVTAAGTGGDPWRYIKIDGYAPTLENVATGNYPHWAEGVVIYLKTKATDAQWALKTKFLKTFANDLGSPTIANLVNTTQAWGKTGIFATTKDPRGFVATIPFNTASPVVPFTHIKTAPKSHVEVVPVADNAAKGGLQLQLK